MCCVPDDKGALPPRRADHLRRRLVPRGRERVGSVARPFTSEWVLFASGRAGSLGDWAEEGEGVWTAVPHEWHASVTEVGRECGGRRAGRAAAREKGRGARNVRDRSP